MNKNLALHYNNGAVWSIPVHFIADNRAKFYVERDVDTTYQEEYDFVMRDHYEAKDWFFNNMDWDQVKDVAVQIHCPTFDPSDLTNVKDSYLEVE